KAGLEKINAADDYANFLTRTLLGTSNESSKINVLTTDSSGAWEGVQDILRVKNVAQLKAPRAFVKEDFNEEKENADISALAFDSAITRQLVPVSDLLRGTRANTGVMLGNGAQATDTSSIAIGKDDPDCKNVDGTYGCFGAKALAERAIAIGLSAEAKNFQGIAIGVNAKVSANSSIAIGPYTKATEGDSIVMGNHAQATKDNSIVIGHKANSTGSRGVALGFNAETSDVDTVAIGFMAHTMGKSSVAIGGEYNSESTHGPDDYTTAKSDYSTAVGAVSKALGFGSTAIGHRAKAVSQHAISFGFYSEAQKEGSIAIGANSLVSVEDGVAIGRGSASGRAAGKFGYTPLLQGPTKNTEAQWKSTRGGVSVGNNSKGITRQITGVAAGSEVTDAVNVSQLKDLEDLVRKNGWKLSVGDKNATTVLMDSGVDFSAGSSNLNITKGEDDNKLKFDLAQDVTLTSLKAGTNTFDATGLVITDGPKITISGIDASSKKITGVATGTDDTDAVNFAQLKAAQEAAIIKGLKINTTGEDFADAAADAENSVSIGSKASVDKLSSGALAFGSGASVKDVGSKDDPEGSLNGIALGANASVAGAGGVALGAGAKANGESAFALGAGAEANGESAFALGAGARSSSGGVAIGVNAESMVDSITIGHNAKTNGQGSVVLGANAIAKGISSVVIGEKAQALDSGSVVIGSNASVDNNSRFAVVLGEQAKVAQGATYALALGRYAEVAKNATSAIALGQQAKVESGATSAIAFGTSAKVSVKDGIALGSNSVANVGPGVAGYDPSTRENADKQDNTWIGSLGALSIGDAKQGKTRQIVGVAAGTNDSDAVNVAQLKALQDSINPSWELSVNGKNTTNVNSTNPMDLVTGSTNLNLTKGDKDNKVQFDLAKNIALESVKAGTNTLDATGLVITGGPKITTDGIDAGSKKITGIQDGALTAESTEAVNGSQLLATNTEIKEVRDSILVKQVAQKRKTRNLLDGGEGPITIGRETGGSEISILNKENGGRKLSGLLGGAINETSDEAVSGSQLHTLGTGVASYFGGGASYADGKWTAPTFKVKTFNKDGTATEKPYSDVASAFAGVGDSFENVKDKFENVQNEIKNAKEKSLNWSEKEQAFVAKIGGRIGSNGEPEAGGFNSKITSLADGDISVSSTDAINGSQLFETNDKVATYFGGSAAFKDGSFTAPTYNISNITEDGTVTTNPYNDVGSAFAGLDTSVKNVNTHLTNEVKKFDEKLTNITQAVQGDALLWDKTTGAFVALHGEKEGKKQNSKITSLADGSIVAGSSDAVTGGQINTIAASLAKILGGKASFSADGTFTVPSYDLSTVSKEGNVTNKSYEGVETAFKGLDDNIKTVNDRIKEVSQGVAQDSLSWSNESNAFVALHGEKGKKTNSKITSLAAGSIVSGSSDAITGGQVYDLQKQFAGYLGGGAGYNEEGKWQAPTFKVKTIKEDGTSGEGDYSDVASAFAGVGSSFTNIKNELNKEINKVVGDSLVKQDEKTKVINIGKETEGTSITIANKAGADRTLSGVKEAANDNEAVNKGQLDKGLKDLSNSLQSDESAVVHYDKTGDENGSINYTSVTLGKGKGSPAVGLHNVADGKISKDSHDAITGGQVNAIASDLSKILGGAVSFDGKNFTGPTYDLSTVSKEGKVTNKSYEGVETAFKGLDDNIKTVNDRIKEVSEGVAQDSLLWGGDAFVAQHEKDGKKENSKITSLADGSIVSGSSDAITGGQIYDLRKQFAGYLGGGAGYNEKGEWQNPDFQIQTFNNDGTKGDKKSSNNVAGAFNDINDSMSTINDRIKEVSEGVAQDSLSWSKTEGAFVALHGEDGK
ncbi:hypothetical protein, partial [Bartonella sp. MF74HXZ]|uniref:hypothetical protein n=1 Tax=Bartonella sp. MF74HXZ TaxID=1461006 RepID=UPI0035D104E9